MKKRIEPYRVLFPLGLILGFLGVSVWILSAFRPAYGYPIQLHSQLMVGAFLLSFASGFLMTAIPKMTASFPAHDFEILGAGALIVLSTLSAYLAPALFFSVSALTILSLILFFIRRFVARTKSPPPFFPYVLFGLLSGLIGSALQALPLVTDPPPELLIFGKKLYFDGMILFLVLGIGSRLIPVISKRPLNEVRPGLIRRNIVLALCLVAGFACEAVGQPLLAGVLKLAVVSWVAYFDWGLFSASKSSSRLAHGMRFSGFLVCAGLYMSVLQPAYATHWMHLCYVSGFGLMTLTVASRVTLAHGHHDLAFESQSPALWICGALVLTAAATRVAAPFTGPGYTMHLVYAAVIWMLALLLWGVVFVKRMIWHGSAVEGC